MATNFEVLFVRWIANLTEGHLPAIRTVAISHVTILPAVTRTRVANTNLLIRASLIIALLLKILRLNIFSENCEEKFSKNEQFSSRPLFICSPANSGMKFPKGFRFGQKFE